MGFIHRSISSMVVVLFLSGLAGAQGSGYAVQFGAFTVKEEADEKVTELKAKDIAAYIVKSDIPEKGVYYRVRAGFFTNYSQAKRFGVSLQERNLVSEYFITAYERPNETTASGAAPKPPPKRSEEHTSELQSLRHLVCRLLLEK